MCAGHARIYQWNGTSWNQLGQDIDGETNNGGPGDDLINAGLVETRISCETGVFGR